jgi:hypothetical protein
LRLTAPAQAFDWNPSDAQALPERPVNGATHETIRLVPYGCTKFRISMFPVAAPRRPPGTVLRTEPVPYRIRPWSEPGHDADATGYTGTSLRFTLPDSRKPLTEFRNPPQGCRGPFRQPLP